MGVWRSFQASITGTLLLCWASPVFAGAWTLEPKSRQVISTLIIDRADELFGSDVAGAENPNFSKFESGIYIEQGLTSRVTLIGQSSFQTVSFNNGVEQVSFNGLGNSSIGLRRSIYASDKQVLSGEFHFIVNGGGEDVPDGDLGRGDISVEARGLYGRNIKVGGKPGFVDVQFGLRPRLNNDPLEWRTDISAGVQLTDKFMILGQGFYTQNNGTLRDPLDPVFPTKSLKGQVSVVYWLKPKYGIQLGAFTTLAGDNVVREEALIFGLWQRF